MDVKARVKPVVLVVPNVAAARVAAEAVPPAAVPTVLPIVFHHVPVVVSLNVLAAVHPLALATVSFLVGACHHSTKSWERHTRVHTFGKMALQRTSHL